MAAMALMKGHTTMSTETVFFPGDAPSGRGVGLDDDQFGVDQLAGAS